MLAEIHLAARSSALVAISLICPPTRVLQSEHALLVHSRGSRSLARQYFPDNGYCRVLFRQKGCLRVYVTVLFSSRKSFTLSPRRSHGACRRSCFTPK